jgi:hypothetical protein
MRKVGSFDLICGGYYFTFYTFMDPAMALTMIQGNPTYKAISATILLKPVNSSSEGESTKEA